MQIILNNEPIPVLIYYKKIKNLYFRFDEDRNLVVSANHFTRESEILKIIEKNKPSLERMLNKVDKKRKKEEEFWYLGNPYQVIYDHTSELTFDNGTIICKNEEELNKFIKEQTKRIFKEEVESLKKVIPTEDFTLKIRKMKTRWGVCNYKTKTITLNSELIKYKKEDLQYVIVHEMCHFTHHDHSRQFWKMVSIYYPNYKEARKDLRE